MNSYLFTVEYKIDDRLNHNEESPDDFESISAQFYKKNSFCDLEELKENHHEWTEPKLKEANDKSLFFIKTKFDFFDKDFDMNLNVSLIDDINEKHVSSEDTANFSREEVVKDSKFHSTDGLSVCTDKGSVDHEHKEQQPLAPPVVEQEPQKVSNFWKRIDMRQKKVIRGLSGLTKEYFRSLIQNKKSKHEIFKTWDAHLKVLIPQVYAVSRLALLGQISVMCFSWKFSEKVKECQLFSNDECEEIIKHGSEFRDERNKCSSSKVRKLMLASPIVQIGKLLYSSSAQYEELFWSQILERKKAMIVDFDVFKEVHLKDIMKVKAISCSAPILI